MLHNEGHTRHSRQSLPSRQSPQCPRRSPDPNGRRRAFPGGSRPRPRKEAKPGEDTLTEADYKKSPWLKISRKYIKPGMSHEMDDIRAAIARGSATELARNAQSSPRLARRESPGFMNSLHPSRRPALSPAATLSSPSRNAPQLARNRLPLRHPSAANDPVHGSDDVLDATNTRLRADSPLHPRARWRVIPDDARADHRLNRRLYPTVAKVGRGRDAHVPCIAKTHQYQPCLQNETHGTSSLA